MSTTMTRSILTIALLVFGALAYAQPKAKIEKALDRFRANEMEEAIADMHKLLEDEPSEEGWEVLVNMYHYRWKDALDPSARLAKQLMENITMKNHVMEVRDAAKCYRDLVNGCLEASLYSRSTIANYTLRAAIVDHHPDTTRTAAAKESMEKAEDAFAEKNYAAAMGHYRDMLRESPKDYQATLYIGDCHYYLEALDSAAYYFGKAVAMEPELMEPRKYLVDALGHGGRTEEALEQAFYTFRIYPDESMFLKTRDLFKRQKRGFDRHWVLRPGPVNLMGVENQTALKGVWKEYRAAKAELAPYCDENGVVVKEGAPAGAKYLEVYSWQRMLEKGGKLPEEMQFAKRMLDAGDLDLYVFLCVFHHGFYDQYKSFIAANGARVAPFISTRLAE